MILKIIAYILASILVFAYLFLVLRLIGVI